MGSSPIIVTNPSDGCDPSLRRVFANFGSSVRSLHLRSATVNTRECPVDIWIRDWGPVAGCYFKYKPSYARGTFTQSAVAAARRNLNRHLGVTPCEIPLVLEGGNLIHNGAVAIVTEKVFADNRQLTRGEVERLIISAGFERVVFIPVEPEDQIGHADGIVKFLTPELLLVNGYTGADFAAYRRRLYRAIDRAETDAEIVPFPWFCTDEKHDGIWSAVGCYINFVSTSRGIIFPTFNHPLDDRVAVLLDQLSPLQKRSIESTALARLGGVLHCATLTF